MTHRRWCLAIPALSVLSFVVVACTGRGKENSTTDSAVAEKQATANSLTEGPFAFVSNEVSDNISIIDTRTDSVIGTIFVGKRPRGIRASPDRKTVFVALTGSPRGGPGIDESKLPPPDQRFDGIAEIDVATRRLRRILPGGPDPETFDVSADGRTLYVSNEDSATASVLDVATGRVTHRIPVGKEPEGVAISPDGRTVWVTSEAESKVTVIDTKSDSGLTSLATGKRPRNVVFAHDGSKAYVTAEMGGVVNVTDARNFRVVKTITIPGQGEKPMGAALSPDGGRLYVTTGRGGKVAVINTVMDSVVSMVSVGARPWGIAVTPDGRKVYVANGPSNDVSVVDTRTLRVIATIKVGSVPGGIAIIPASKAGQPRTAAIRGDPADTSARRPGVTTGRLPQSHRRLECAAETGDV